MDCGSALSLVIGQQRPRYEVFGKFFDNIVYYQKIIFGTHVKYMCRKLTTAI